MPHIGSQHEVPHRVTACVRQGSGSLQGSRLELAGSASILEQLGDGGFDAEDLQLQRLLGQLNFVMPL